VKGKKLCSVLQLFFSVLSTQYFPITCHLFSVAVNLPPPRVSLKRSFVMKKFYLSLAILAIVFALSVVAASANSSDNGALSPAAIGTVVEDFRLPDTDGHEHTLASLKGKNGTVLIFIAVQCPVSNAYNERMEKLYEDYKARGVSVVGINANTTESAAEVKAHAKEKGLNFVILKDTEDKIADRLGAGHTPEAFFLDAAGKLVYHGAIDNAMNPVMVNTNHLRNAIDATLEGKQVERADVKAFGCSIKRAGGM
jgi:peroxiredoxin